MALFGRAMSNRPGALRTCLKGEELVSIPALPVAQFWQGFRTPAIAGIATSFGWLGLLAVRRQCSADGVPYRWPLQRADKRATDKKIPSTRFMVFTMTP